MNKERKKINILKSNQVIHCERGVGVHGVVLV